MVQLVYKRGKGHQRIVYGTGSPHVKGYMRTPEFLIDLGGA